MNLFLILGGHIEPIFFFDCPRQAMESRKKKDHIPAASAAPSQGPSTGAGSQDPSIRAPPQDPTTLETLAYDADAEAASYGTPYILEKDPGLLLTVESAWKVDHLLRKGAAEMDDAALAKQLHDHAPGTCEAPFTEEKLHLASPTIEKSDAFAAFALQENMDERSFGPQDSEPADVFQHPGASPEGGHLGMAEEDGKVRDGKDVDMLEPQRKAEPAQVVEPVLAAEPDEAVQPVQVVVDESPAKVTEAEPAKVTAKVPEPGDEPKPLEHGAPHDMVAKEEVVSMLECMLSDGMDLKDAIAQVKGAPLVLRVEQFKNKSGQAAERPDDDVEPSQLPGQSGTPKAKPRRKPRQRPMPKAKPRRKPRQRPVPSRRPRPQQKGSQRPARPQKRRLMLLIWTRRMIRQRMIRWRMIRQRMTSQRKSPQRSKCQSRLKCRRWRCSERPVRPRETRSPRRMSARRWSPSRRSSAQRPTASPAAPVLPRPLPKTAGLPLSKRSRRRSGSPSWTWKSPFPSGRRGGNANEGC